VNDDSLIRCLKTRPAKHGERGWRCPEEIAIAAYADGRLAGKEKLKIERHLADCDFCLEQVAFLARVRYSDVPAAVPAPLLARAREMAGTKTGFALLPAWTKVAAAAVACLALVTIVSVRVGLHQSPGSSSSSPSATRPEAAGEVRGHAVPTKLSVLSPASESTVERIELEFRWEAAPRALDYDVRVLTADGDVVWAARTEKNLSKLPADVKLEAGRKYFALVQANLAEGKTIKSDAIGFTVRAATY